MGAALRGSGYLICEEHSDLLEEQLRAHGLGEFMRGDDYVTIDLISFQTWRMGFRSRSTFVPLFVAMMLLIEYAEVTLRLDPDEEQCLACRAGRAHFMRCRNPKCGFSVLEMFRGTSECLVDILKQLPE